MPRVIITEAAALGLERCRQFLLEKSTEATKKAAALIEQQFSMLESQPEMGRPFNDLPELRELLIPFGGAGYVALYFYDKAIDEVTVLAFRHQKEAGY
ncbi:MAG: type II toxin-antitoxin system RelE/ParE family toxin [Pseudomonadota bacterium]